MISNWILALVLFALGNDLCEGLSGTTLQMLTAGDWGEILFNGQERVAAAMAEWTSVNNPEFILGLGDNIYPWGIFSVDDNQINRKWRDVYHKYKELAFLQWRFVHGNHDVGFDNGEEWYQVQLTDIEPLWYFPNLWWDFVVEKDDFSVHFFMVDTESMRKDSNNHEEMWPWLEDKLATSTADWKMVVGHREVFAVGSKGPANSRLNDRLRPLMEQYGVDVYICGHDHNLQHIRKKDFQPGDVDYVVNGASGQLWYAYNEEKEQILNDQYGMEVSYFEMVWGFVPITITKDFIHFDFIRDDGSKNYEYTRYRSDQKRRE